MAARGYDLSGDGIRRVFPALDNFRVELFKIALSCRVDEVLQDKKPAVRVHGQIERLRAHVNLGVPLPVTMRLFVSFNRLAFSGKLLHVLLRRPVGKMVGTAKWTDIDLDRVEWKYTVLKTKTEHLVPLSYQAVEILRDIQTLTGEGEYVFAGVRPGRPMSDMTINRALQTMGYDTKTEITGHGFRAMARTLLAERLRVPEAVIEHQLAHKVPDTLGTAYNRTKFIDDRWRMMSAWANYLEKLKTGDEAACFPAAGNRKKR